MNKIKIALGIAVTAFVMVGCKSNQNEIASHIPKDATAVVAVHAGKMLAKLEADGMSVEQMLGAMKGIKANEMAEVLSKYNELKDAGIDWEQPFFLAMVTDTSMQNDPLSVVMLAAIKDADKLAATIAKQTGKTPEKKGGMQTVTHNNDVVAWNSDMVIATIDKGGIASVQNLFALKSKASITESKHFNEALAKNADIMIYTSGTSLNNPEAAMALAMVPKAKELAEGIETTSYINFEDGKAVMQNETFVGEALGKLLDKYAGPQVDLSLIERYGSKDLQTVAAFSFKPELVPAIIQELGVAPLVSMPLAQENITLEEMGKLFKGDFAVMVGGIAFPEKDKGKDDAIASYAGPNANLVVAARIGDKAIFDKLVNKAVEKGLIKIDGNKILLSQEDAELKNVVVGIEGDLLVMANNAETYTAYATGTKTELSAEMKKAVSGQSTAIFVDLQSILNRIPEPMVAEDAPAMALLAEARKIFRTTHMSLSNYSNGKLTGTGELTMATGKNGLTHLAHMFIAAANASQTNDTANAK